MTHTVVHDVLVAALGAIGVNDAAAALTLNPDITFAALQVDSLGIIEVVAHLESQCGVGIPDERIATFERPADLLAYALQPNQEA